jgi:hypothetical protein
MYAMIIDKQGVPHMVELKRPVKCGDHIQDLQPTVRACCLASK